MRRKENQKYRNTFTSFLFVGLLAIPQLDAVSKPGYPSLYKASLPEKQELVIPGLMMEPAMATVYESMKLSAAGLSQQVFEFAMIGFRKIFEAGKINNDGIISIIDFSKPSSQKRLYVLDLKTQKLLFKTYVAHGMNSGKEMARYFSNAPESNKSSLGFYSTADTYIGKHGYSLHLNGLEKGINDKAYERDIVMHAADYVNESMIRSTGCAGRSWGCPAVPEKFSKPIIDRIKNGTCLFIYAPDKNYLKRSQFIEPVKTKLILG